jgi:hypothetical protein
VIHVEAEAFGKLVKEIAAHGAELRRLSIVVGTPATEDTDASGLVEQVSELRRVFGQAPNDATGEPGSGLCKVLAELARCEATRRASIMKASGVAAAVAVGAAEGILRLIQHFGG